MKTLVLGATENPSRYANMAIRRLRGSGQEVIGLGRKAGKVMDVEIVTAPPMEEDIDTVTLYLNPQNQRQYYDYILSLRPRRIIYNPGTENPELQKLAKENGIENILSCTLVMLSMGNY
jgi:predicted CoA-binding protein